MKDTKLQNSCSNSLPLPLPRGSTLIGVVLLTLGLGSANAATRIWTGPGTDIQDPANWGGTLPTASADVAQFNGTIAGSLSLSYNTTATTILGGSTGLTWHLTGAQTGAVSLNYAGTDSTNSTIRLGTAALTLDSGAGAMAFGDGVGGVAIPSATTGTALKLVLGSGATAQTITFTNNSANTVTFNPDVYLSNGGGSNKTLAFAGSGNFAMNNVIGPDVTGNKGVSVVGTGTVALTGANTYTLGTSVGGGGTLEVSNIGNTGSTTSNLGTNSTINLTGNGGSGRLRYTGAGETSNRVINLAGGTAGSTNAIIDHSGTGLLRFTGNLTATGGLVHTLVLQGSTAGTGEIAGAILNNSGTNLTSLTKQGSGTWTLSGSNPYTGATSITGGKLLVDGALTGSATTVDSGGTLGGTGTLLGITLNTGGAIEAGTTTNDLAATSLSWKGEASNAFSQMKFELGSTANLGAAAESDKLTLSGAFTKDTSTGSVFQFDFLGTGATGNTYMLASFGSTTFTAGDFSYTGLASGLTGTFSVTGGNLEFGVIPEPGIALMLLGGLGMLCFRRPSHTARKI